MHKGLKKRGELTVENSFQKEDVANLVTAGIQRGIEMTLNVNQDTSNEVNDENSPSLEHKALLKRLKEQDDKIKRLESEKANPVQNAAQWNQLQMPPWHPAMMVSPYHQPFMDSTNCHNNFNNQDQNKNNKYIKYCWTCGANVTHWSKKCTKKKGGHQDKANFKNKMNGNSNSCWS